MHFCCNCISQNSPKTCLNALEIRKIMTKFNCNIFSAKYRKSLHIKKKDIPLYAVAFKSTMRKIISIYLVLFGIMTCNAQGVSLHDLENKTWQEEDNGITFTYEFTKDSVFILRNNTITGKTINVSKPFYLSDVKNESFDSTKVGTETSGRYLLTYNKKTKCTEYCEITKLTPDTLELFYEAKENHIGAANMYFTYRRVK